MKTNLLMLTFLICFIFSFQKVQSKNEDQTHHFKIVGNTHLQTPKGEKVVEYDPASPDHLFISDFDKAGKITVKRQFLFTGKQFDLSVDYLKYMKKKEIMIDGSHTFYRDGIMEKTINYRKEEIISQISYYPNGQQQSMVPGEDVLNGEYKLWHPGGQLSFTGHYTDNLKEGDFELFDESGKSLKKGTYKEGKLLSGKPVIMDIIYKNPEVAARYETGEEAFNQYLTTKAAGIGPSKIVYSDKEFYLNIVFDANGTMTDIYNTTSSDAAENESVKSILKACPAFTPAMVENIPVKSSQLFTLKVTADGVKLESGDKIYTSVDESPQFRGGPMALRNYITSHLTYPAKAQQSGIQGKVFVSFVVNKDGKVSDAHVVQGVHPLLDEEALRVVNDMPKWKPGKMDEKPVRVAYTMPIGFNLTAPQMAR
ncbi:MAG TPA: TonB family protein [Prolixibacteraceae bacterium]|nr:TonB family protein [Prolixibacteraceae bacterium]